jgi:integrase
MSIVRSGALKIEVQQYADSRYGFDYKPLEGLRKKVRLHSEKDAINKARELLGAANAGHVDRMAIDESEYSEFLQWKASRRKQSSVEDLKTEFIASKEGKGGSGYLIARLKTDLGRFVKAFPLANISQLDHMGREVEKWLNSMEAKPGQPLSPRRWNNILANVVSLLRYARRNKLLPAEKTAVELIERKRVTVRVTIYTPDELRKLIAAVKVKREKTEADWLPYILFSAFAGIRPEELNPSIKSGKTAFLSWENILWEKGKIDIPAEVSKVRQRRFIPIHPTLARMLKKYRKNHKGKIAPNGRISNQTAKWKELSGVQWKSDALRHSYASYKLALTSDVAALSFEMGNSPTMIKRHYLELVHEAEARAWFQESSKSVKRGRSAMGAMPV